MLTVVHDGTQAHAVPFVQAGVLLRVLPQPSASSTSWVPAPPPHAPEQAPMLVVVQDDTQAQAALAMEQAAFEPPPLPLHVHVWLPPQLPAL